MAAQAGLCLAWLENPEDTFCRVVAHMVSSITFVHLVLVNHLSCDMTKPTKWVCTQRRLRSAWASAQSDQSLSLCAHWVAKDPSFLLAHSEDSDQTGRRPRLIWVFAGHTATLLVLLCRGSSLSQPRNSVSRFTDPLKMAWIMLTGF